MCPEEIAQTHKGSNSLDISGWFGILDGFEFIFAWFDSFWSEREAQVGDFLVSEDTFFQIYLEMIFV